MTTLRQVIAAIGTAMDTLCARFDDRFCHHGVRSALRNYGMELLLPREHNKILTVADWNEHLPSFIEDSRHRGRRGRARQRHLN
jgi:hypothetical protein